ncbi:MAG TPA: gluconate 2-dehydrogenase subunit 3 family protein, partial [Streptosporangiaceae bacterium]|nr:gluconate 2-dehydrogenase subunit 3 family protein [Streptosporangiaceae bacterium]
MSGGPDRFPGFDALSQVRHWDPVTADAVLARVAPPAAVKFFTDSQEACARALLNLLTGQEDGDLAVPVLEMVDARLAAGETDGWRYADMPKDGQAWRDTLAYLDGDAHERFVTSFAGASREEETELVQAVQDADRWHGMPAGHVWSLWTRYACTAFYSHPAAWAEIGFP